MEKSFWRLVAQVCVDAFDVDLRRFQSGLLRGIASTPTGTRFASWAAQNPLLFEVFVRALSATALPAGRKLRRNGTAAEALARQLEALPFEFREAFLDAQHATAASAPAIPGVEYQESELEQAGPFYVPSTLSEAVAHLDRQRSQGEFLGALCREGARRLAPDRLDELRRSQRDSFDFTQSPFSSTSQHSREKRQEHLDCIMPLALGVLAEKEGINISNAELQELQAKFLTADTVAAHVENPIIESGRKQFGTAFLFGLDSPPEHSPTVADFGEIEDFIRMFVRGSIAESDVNELEALARDLGSTRLAWNREARPTAWLLALSVADEELARRATAIGAT